MVLLLICGAAFAVLGLHALIKGEFIFRKAGIYLYGTPARIAAVADFALGVVAVWYVLRRWDKTK